MVIWSGGAFWKEMQFSPSVHTGVQSTDPYIHKLKYNMAGRKHFFLMIDQDYINIKIYSIDRHKVVSA